MPQLWARLSALAVPDWVAEGVAVAEDARAPVALALVVVVAVAEAEADELPPDSASVAFWEPQVTDMHPACPSRSSGWLAMQFVFHCSQMKKGNVCV